MDERPADVLPDHGGPDRMELVETLIGLFRALAAATHAHGFIRERDQDRASLGGALAEASEPEVTQ